MKYSIFIFRRDLRIEDNTTLNYLLKNYNNVIPVFIFTPEQVKNNKFKSDNAIQFMIESLHNLDHELKKYGSRLHVFYGKNKKILKRIMKKVDIECIGYNKDYTNYAQSRDKKIASLCKKSGIECISNEDYLLKKMGELNKDNGETYTVYTPFKNNCLKHKIDKPIILSKKEYSKLSKLPENLLKEEGYIDHEINPDILVKGGRDKAIVTLNNALKLKNYEGNRNDLSYTTSLLSAYIKFGNISIREAYHAIKDKFGLDSGLLAQLIWREFYFYISYYFPRVLEGKNYNKKYDNIDWIENNQDYKKWCNGETGYPVVDAGMRELNKTGYMHNRSRLITSNFLNRMLGMDWRLGEIYFAKKLTDYDPSINNGNWQWVSSVGVDPKPYFQRLFNPILQSEKFDSNAEYIKKWIPSLEKIPSKELHNWGDNYHKYNLKDIEYVKPIVVYSEARKRSVAMYRAVL